VKDFLSDEELKHINKVSHVVLRIKQGFNIFIMSEFEKDFQELRKILSIVDRNFYAWVLICKNQHEVENYLPLLTDKGNIIKYERFSQWIEAKI